MNFSRITLTGAFFLAGALTGAAQEAAPPAAQGIPEHLLDDDHVREEMGVNQFTAPSIKKLFEETAAMHPLAYDELHLNYDKLKIPSGRTRIALQLGVLMADGFLCIDAEQHEDVIRIARGILNRAKALGLGRRLEPHSKSLVEKSLLDDWTGLRTELSATQKDVERELVSLRDVGVAHLISLGGWIRAFEIAAVSASRPYSEKKAEHILRLDLIHYFGETLTTMAPGMRERDLVLDLRDAVLALESDITALNGKAPTEEQLKGLEEKARILSQFLQESIQNP